MVCPMMSAWDLHRALARSRVPRRAGCRAFRDGARNPARIDRRHGPLCAPLSRRAQGSTTPSLGRSVAHPRHRSVWFAAAKRALPLASCSNHACAEPRQKRCNPRVHIGQHARAAVVRDLIRQQDLQVAARRSLDVFAARVRIEAPARRSGVYARCEWAASCSTECSGVSRRANNLSPFRPASVCPSTTPGSARR